MGMGRNCKILFEGVGMKPEVSIIVPVYRVEAFLDRCVKSILNQTYQNFELILVDDGSPDQCPEMCDRWAMADQRIRVLHKTNGGLSSARNAGLDVAKGKYIHFVDSDDWLERDAVEYLYTILKENNADMAMAEYTRKENSRIPQNEEQVLWSQREFLRYFFKLGTQLNVQYAWGKLYRAELFQGIRYPLGLTAEDVPTTFEIALRCKKIVYSTKIIYHYSINPDSITGQSFSEKNFDLLTVWDLVCEKASSSKDKWIIQGAYLNRKRADFGILSELALANIPYSEKIKYLPQAFRLQKELKKNAVLLYKSKIPFSRKMLIFIYCISYPTVLRTISCILSLKEKL